MLHEATLDSDDMPWGVVARYGAARRWCGSGRSSCGAS
jgi:hypothetical protein